MVRFDLFYILAENLTHSLTSLILFMMKKLKIFAAAMGIICTVSLSFYTLFAQGIGDDGVDPGNELTSCE